MIGEDLSEFITLFGGLATDVEPRWGIMTPHHVLEHLSASFRMSNGGILLQQAIPDAQIPERLAFLYSNDPFPKNLKNAALPPGGLRPLKTSSMAEAHLLLVVMWEKFEDYFRKQPEILPIHPLFGPLTYAQWNRFHARHMEHHAIQFKLLPEN